jgi:hypothetical protein
MKAKPTHNLAVATSKYTDRDGNQKSRYKTVGMLFEREDGSQFLALDASIVSMELQWIVNPDHNDKVMMGLYPVDSGDGEQQQRRAQETRRGEHRGETYREQRRAAGLSPDLDDEIPF